MPNIDYAVNVQDYEISLTNIDEEYAQELPAHTKAIEFLDRAGLEIRHSFTQGLVAGATGAYQTLKSSEKYAKEHLNLNKHTIYFASSAPGSVIELRVWV